MDATAPHIAQLIYRSITGLLTVDEASELSAWANAHPQNAALITLLQDDTAIREAFFTRSPSALAALDKELYANIQQQLGWDAHQRTDAVPMNKRNAHRVHFLKTTWFRYAAAVLLLLGIGSYFWLKPTSEKNSTAIHNSLPVHDIIPGGKKAVLTLADGSTIVLDSAAKGQLALQGNASIVKLADGQIAYSVKGKSEGVAQINTMSTPKGGQYQLTLPDGTKVWLNASSSITYPAVFVQNNRTVKITGEAYFEVAKNASKPFIVQTYKDEIRVLGTNFNINAYTDETSVKTSLTEGSVQVNNQVLHPGEAYQYGKIVKTDIGQDIAWKDGLFDFNKVSLEQAMKQISKWYDVDVIYEKNIPNISFWGKMRRDLNLSQVLNFLQKTGVKFRLENDRKLIVTN